MKLFNKQPIVFVTGINGLLGTNLVNLLLENGYYVIGLARNIDSYKGNKTDNLQLIHGDLFNDYSNLLEDVDIVIHVAAVTGQNILDNDYYLKINYSATKQLYQSAINCNVKKFIFVSTANTIGYGSSSTPGTEDTEIHGPIQHSIYAQSKLLAENFLLTGPNHIDTIIVNPTFMLGAHDTKPSSGRIIKMALKKMIIFYPPGGKNFVHVEDVANGILKAIDKGQNNEKYLLCNENLSYRDFFIKVNKLSDQHPMMIQVPKPILMIVGKFGDMLRKLNIATSLSSVNMRMLCEKPHYSNNKSKQDLDLNYQPIENAITDAINYFSNQ